MKNLLTIFKPKHQRQQEMKERILKNKEAVLDIMAKNIEGARQCPHLIGAKCLGQFCEFFIKLNSFDEKTGQTKDFWRCAIVETPVIIIELNSNIRRLINIIEQKGGVNV